MNLSFHKIKKHSGRFKIILRKLFFYQKISTLLFSAFPFAVLLDAIGLVSPKPVF
jgi:hypothetical protein